MGPWGGRVGTWWGSGDVPILVRLGPGEVLVENYTQYLHSGGWLDSGAWFFILEVSKADLLWISDPVRPCFLAITSSDLAQLVPNFHTLHFSPSADFCQYGLLTKNR